MEFLFFAKVGFWLSLILAVLLFVKYRKWQYVIYTVTVSLFISSIMMIMTRSGFSSYLVVMILGLSSVTLFFLGHSMERR